MSGGRPRKTAIPVSFYASPHLSVTLLLLGLTLKAQTEMPEFTGYSPILPSAVSVQYKDDDLAKKTQ